MRIKKTAVVIAVVSGAAICAYGEFQVDFSKIRHWSGDGENEAALVVQFLDDYENKAYVWGFRWSDEEDPTGEGMIRKIAAESDDLCALVQLTGVYGSTLDGVGYSRNNAILNHLYYDFEGAIDDPYIMFDFYNPNLMMGQLTAPGDEASGMCKEAISKAFDSHIIEHPLNYTQFGYPAYDYDWWKADTMASDMRWNSGWYEGYWSYWLGNKESLSSEYAYSGLGMTNVKLKNGDVNAWKYMLLDGPLNPDDFVDGVTGASVAWADKLDYLHFEDFSSVTPIFIEDHADQDTDIFDIHGKFMGRFHKGQPFDFPTGIYVGKRGSETIKFYHR